LGHYVCGLDASGVKFNRTLDTYKNYPISNVLSGLNVKCCPFDEPNVVDYMKVYSENQKIKL
jgi:hypothetical protein